MEWLGSTSFEIATYLDSVSNIIKYFLEAMGIGKTNKKAVPLRISEPRPKGLGLGASTTPVPTKLSSEQSDKNKDNGKNETLRDSNKKNGTITTNDDNDDDEDVDLKAPKIDSYVRCLG